MSRSKQQRLMQLPAVLEYMGKIGKGFFDENIRHQLTEVKMGYRTIMFEKEEVDGLIEKLKKGELTCHKNYRQESGVERMGDTKSTKSIPQPKVTKLSAYEQFLATREK